jgi:hypothetical protein
VRQHVVPAVLRRERRLLPRGARSLRRFARRSTVGALVGCMYAPMQGARSAPYCRVYIEVVHKRERSYPVHPEPFDKLRTGYAA